MVIKMAAMLTMAVLCLAATAHAQALRHVIAVKHAAIVAAGDAEQNILDSKRYEQMLRTNPAFRKARMHKECGGITDPQLRQSCIASFDKYKS